MSANPKQYEQVWAKWQRWFETSSNTVRSMFHDRQLFEELRDAIIEHGPNDTGTWLLHYARLYLSKQVMAARRIMDKADGSESFWQILHGIEQSPKVIDRERFLSASGNQADWALEERSIDYDKLRSPSGDWIDPEVIKYLRLVLEADADMIVTYASRAIAHTDQKGAPSLTWDELSQAIDDLGTHFQQFGSVFHATHYELLPVVQDDWQGPFRRWLFEPSREPRDPNLLPGG
jgi:hypothetical protein